MIETIESLCAEAHNYFEESKEINDYSIENGIISLPFLSENQFFRIVGSKFNDGIYIYSEKFIIRDATWEDVLSDHPDWESLSEEEWGSIKHNVLTDETFHGGIWPMRMPKAFLSLAKEVYEYNSSDKSKPSPYASENISGHYSYTKASPSDNAWQNVFKSKLNRWRKVANNI